MVRDLSQDTGKAATGRPDRVVGLYIDMSGRGCKTCGWYISNDADESDQQWIDHDHDPMYDIEARLFSGAQWVPVADVVWLLAKYDPGNWAVQADDEPVGVHLKTRQETK